METITLKVLSAVETEADVFGKVITVEDTEGTVFTLGCAHCCRWTVEQLTTADKLEGCYTPTIYKSDERLLLGYHPQTVTTWEVNKTPDGVYVTMSTHASVANAQQFDVEFDYPLTIHNEDTAPNLRVLKSLWDQSRVDREPAEAVLSFYRTLSGLCSTGRIPLDYGQLAWRLVLEPSLSDDWLRENDVQFWDFSRPRFSESFYKRLIVRRTEPECGFASAWGLDLTFLRINPDEDWVIESEYYDEIMNQYGIDVDIYEEWIYPSSGCNYARRKVAINDPDEGFAIAIPLP